MKHSHLQISSSSKKILNFLKKLTLALPGGALGMLVHFQIFPTNCALTFFLRPGGAGAPTAPPLATPMMSREICMVCGHYIWTLMPRRHSSIAHDVDATAKLLNRRLQSLTRRTTLTPTT